MELRPNLNKEEQDAEDISFKNCVTFERELRKDVQKGKEVRYSFIDFIEAWESELRDLQQKHNLGMPRQKDARFAMAGGK